MSRKVKQRTNEKAITLIVLIITIILLIILAGVTISTLIRPNELIKQAEKAKEETNSKSVEELIKLMKYMQ